MRVRDATWPGFGRGLGADVKAELLMIGSCSTTYRLGEAVFRTTRVDDNPEITHSNAQAMAMETNVYRILGAHERIAKCLYLGPIDNVVVLKFYSIGNLKDYITAHGPSQLHKWTKQMIEAVEYIHGRGVRHSDIKLCQWLLDSGLNARLSDFNGCGYDAQPLLGMRSVKALSYERQSHFLPRDRSKDNTVISDLFALGSALYELEHGSSPFVEISEERVTEYFTQGKFPPVSDMALGRIILGCWQSHYRSATELLYAAEQL